MEDVAVVVLGAGVGGAAAALLVAGAGVPTTLLEVGPSRAAEARSPSVCLGPRGPLAEVLRRAGAEGALDLRPAPHPDPTRGPAAIAAALARLAEARGAVIRSGARPIRILVEGGRARGVALEAGEGGESLRASAVISALGAAETLELAGGAAAGTRLRGLYLVDSAGALVDHAAASAMACADRVLVDLGRDPGCPPPLGAWGAVGALARRGAGAVIARIRRPRG